MVKILKCSVFFLFMACSSHDCWDYDVNYSRDIMGEISGYYSEGVPNSVVSVDVIQIYSLDDKEKNDLLPLVRLREKQLVRELRNKSDISHFLESFKKNPLEIKEGCPINNGVDPVFHIVVFDTTLQRLAYFRYYLCSIKGVVSGTNLPLGSEVIHYNTEPPIAFLSPQTFENKTK